MRLLSRLFAIAVALPLAGCEGCYCGYDYEEQPRSWQIEELAVVADIDGTVVVTVDERYEDCPTEEWVVRSRRLLFEPGASGGLEVDAAGEISFLERGVVVANADKFELRDRETFAQIASFEAECWGVIDLRVSNGRRFALVPGCAGDPSITALLDGEDFTQLVPLGPTTATGQSSLWTDSGRVLTLVPVAEGLRLLSWDPADIAAQGFERSADGWLAGTQIDVTFAGTVGSTLVLGSPDDAYAVLSSMDAAVQVLTIVNTTTGETRVLEDAKPPVVFDPDGSRLFATSATEPNNMLEIDVATLESLTIGVGQSTNYYGISSIVAVPEADALVVSAAPDPTVRIGLDDGERVPFAGAVIPREPYVLSGGQLFGAGFVLDVPSATIAPLELPTGVEGELQLAGPEVLLIEAEGFQLYFVDTATHAVRSTSFAAP